MTKFFATILILIFSAAIQTAAQTVEVSVREEKQRVDVTIDGKLFTSYRWDERIRRPILLPVMSAGGAFLTRGFPLETRDGETIGHPHQVGASFSYGDVNGVDFWNNSPFRSATELERMGRIVHQKIVRIKSGKSRGELVTESVWVLPNGKTILTETTRYIFAANGETHTIERETTLAAGGEPVVFGDNKEGLFAVHLTRELQQADQFPVKITDAEGNISEAATNGNLTGEYLDSEGLSGDKIWGTLGKWASVSGRIGTEAVTIAVFDAPKNHNFPSSMMVRGYGLLALNPFGRKAFDARAEARKFVLRPGKSIKFRHCLAVWAEKAAPGAIEKEYRRFIK